MKRAGRIALALLMAALLGVPGCGGGGSGGLGLGDFAVVGGGPGPAGDSGGDAGIGVAGVGSGGTGISGDGVGSGGTGAVADGGAVGSVDGFGSIVVNGTHFDISGARLQLDDSAALRLGMTVRVAGTLSTDLASGTATAVLSAADLRGTVENLDAGAGTFSVLSVQVATDPSTVFAGGLTGLADLQAGEPVQVYGLPAGAAFRATRIERLPAAGLPVLSGPVLALDTPSRTFVIGNLRVRYSAAVFHGLWPAAGLSEGMLVRVRAGSAGNPLDAVSIEPWIPALPGDGGRFSVSGIVTRVTSLSDLQVDGVPVDASGARVSGGSTAAIVPGARVEVAGTLRGGVLAATRLKLRHEPSSPPDMPYSATGPIGSLRSAASFRIQGQEIDAGGPGVVFANGSAADLANGSSARVTGSRVVNDVLVAERVEFLR